MNVSNLPLPTLSARLAGTLDIITDDALARTTGVRVAFTGTSGGVSEGPYASLNLATHVGDSFAAVEENRRRLLHALDASDVELVVPNQVHGTNVVSIESRSTTVVERARVDAERGADALVVGVPDVAALLCFADCVPVVIVSPTGRFAVVHAGWRGVVGGVAEQALEVMLEAEASLFGGRESAAASYNVYIGPHIHAECFETGFDVHARFVDLFGDQCAFDDRRIDLSKALSVGLARKGVDACRIVDAGVCTVCGGQGHYSYRASGGTCGRHGALAFRRV
ncbi:MAG: laccase domain-containing protein [Eggerthellaceae bacterium]|nr:laccase domain-containing protein [Eggerthellaceae bacterium]